MFSEDRFLRDKHSMIPGLLKQAGVDAWLVLTRESFDLVIPYLAPSAVVTQPAALLFTPQGSTAVLGAIDTLNSRGKYFDRQIRYWPGSLEDALVPLLKELDPRVLALNYSDVDYTADGLTLGMYRKLEAAMGAEWLEGRTTSSTAIVSDLRGMKSPDELDLMRVASEITMDVAKEVGSHLRPGLTHGDLQSLFYDLVRKDARAQPNNLIPRSGCIGEIYRNTPEAPIQAGDSVVLDMGVKYQGYCSDFQRVWYLLRPGESEAPANLEAAFRICQQIIAEATEKLQAGVRGYEVYAIAKDRLAEKGYDEFEHSLGHTVGRSLHDGGMSLSPTERSPRATEQVKPGMVFSVEPHVNMKEHYPVSVEELVWVPEQGSGQYFVEPQRDIWLVETGS